eukprot:1675512-Prymnesium_polylepis.1
MSSLELAYSASRLQHKHTTASRLLREQAPDRKPAKEAQRPWRPPAAPPAAPEPAVTTSAPPPNVTWWPISEPL